MPFVVEHSDLPGLRGVDLGCTEWVEVGRRQVDGFVELLGESGAREFLALSLTVPLWDRLVEVRGVSTRVNYGLDWVRFGPPVTAGSQVRLAAAVADVVAVTAGFQLTVDVTIEVRGAERPAVVARTLKRLLA